MANINFNIGASIKIKKPFIIFVPLDKTIIIITLMYFNKSFCKFSDLLKILHFGTIIKLKVCFIILIPMDKTINFIWWFFDKKFNRCAVFTIPIMANVKKICPFLFNKFLKIRCTSLIKKIVTQNNKNLCNIWNAWKLANITPDKKNL